MMHGRRGGGRGWLGRGGAVGGGGISDGDKKLSISISVDIYR